ncbi:hypothetical protein V5O48_013440 [Marasmius crinis-equi]|uniref:Uncharacterized protein n=1 Tax=Marasmius crinis-equi TaxID=585013 RepID=A0ABR3F022_9AGAR
MPQTHKLEQKSEPDDNKKIVVQIKEQDDSQEGVPAQQDLKVEISNVNLEEHGPNEEYDLIQLYEGEPYQRHFYPMIHYSQHASLFQYNITCSGGRGCTHGELIKRAWASSVSAGDGKPARAEELDNGMEIQDTYEEEEDGDYEGMPALMELNERDG